MVVKVIGKINGGDIIFNRSEKEERWKAAVPLDLDGEYVVELTAFDEAGNISYVTKMLFSVDPVNLTISVAPLHFYAELIETHDLVFMGDKYILQIIANGKGWFQYD